MNNPLPPTAPPPLLSQAAALPTGTVLASRFTLESLVGRGGMGSIYRARDTLSGQIVALKLLHVDSAEALQRFSREAAVLAELRHPGIVSYVAHGTTADGRPFIAMEWLQGEDLAQRLSRQPLNLEESLALLRQATQALALAHQRGVIHRDLKPSNLFLRQGRPEDVVLLDFGLARHLVPSVALTASQMVIGTPGYMAPEQVSAQSQLTASADIFSLGCVLYECLTGTAPFSAPHFVAALGKILFSEPEPLRALRPELPEALEELLQHMLVKAPEKRLPDAARLLETVSQLRMGLASEPSAQLSASMPPLRLTGSEQHLVSVLVAAPRVTETQPLELRPHDSRWTLRDTLRTLLMPHGAQVELMANGSLVATLKATHGSATDPATLAARCALLIQERWPESTVVLTTGRARPAHLPVGEAMDRAGQLLRQHESLPSGTSASVLLDEVTAGLLGPGFQLSRPQPDLFLLLGESLGADASRPLLGKPTPCVGREQELTLLELAFNTCAQESIAQAVLVTAPAGMGKSRLRHEFLRRLEHQGHQVQVLLGRGDPMSAGSADGLLGHALRQLCAISSTEPLETRRGKLVQQLSRHLPTGQAQEVAGFLGELCGIPFPDEHNPRLRVARADPQLMSTQVGRALVAFFRAECAHHAVLLVLEDLHWGDALSVRLIDEVLRELTEQPFMVLAMARPEVQEIFPNLWARRLQEVPLRGLSRKAGARLVREVLGTEVPEALMERLVEQAAGNALFLEELIRGAAEGRGEAAMQTVLAMLQARLGRLEPQARQVLLAASLLGRTFWRGGVQAVLGGELTSSELDHWLQHLVELEWVELQPASRFPGETEYRFRHALVRDAAYGLVPDSHHPGGHQLAGQWLEQQGETDPRILAEHARLGQQPERAIRFYLTAAERLFDHDDMQGAERCIETALALGPTGEPWVQLRALRAATAFWRNDFATLNTVGKAVQQEMKAGTVRWCKLIDGLTLGCGYSAQKEYVLSLCRLLLDTEPEPEARSAYYLSLCFMGNMMSYLGCLRETEACFEHLERTGSEVIARDGMVRGWRGVEYSFQSLVIRDEAWKALVWAEQSVGGFREVGSERGEVVVLARTAQALRALGDVAGAVERARQSVALALRVSPRFGVSFAEHNLIQVLAVSAEPTHQQEARALALKWVENRSGNRVQLGLAHLVLAKISAASEELAEAEVQARQACEILAPFAIFLPETRWKLNEILLRQGRVAEARAGVELALKELEPLGTDRMARVGLLRVLAESCFAEGDTASGEQALHRALEHLRSRAAAIPDLAVRQRFLHQVPENARVLELARQRWGETEFP
ncbi:serine/threonine-protein kinase [Hyalangium versicolor]|uniref:serine/threonine-protein kinase n=1 Tax=Hyalangium versicolor TaxID=2861190 RepID=UPI001CCE9FA6|nr:serine/threonine-protein kinase [Hyalangium versicolor]